MLFSSTQALSTQELFSPTPAYQCDREGKTEFATNIFKPFAPACFLFKRETSKFKSCTKGCKWKWSQAFQIPEGSWFRICGQEPLKQSALAHFRKVFNIHPEVTQAETSEKMMRGKQNKNTNMKYLFLSKSFLRFQANAVRALKTEHKCPKINRKFYN